MVDIPAFSYFPGRVLGELHRATTPARPGQIALVRHSDLNELAEGWAGIVVCEGAPFSHAMIRILGFGVPTLLIKENDAHQLQEGVPTLLDTEAATVSQNPASELTDLPIQTAASLPPGKLLKTSDGVAISLRASVRNQAAAMLAQQKGAQAIGLVRSEFLLPDAGEMPTAEFYQSAFRQIAAAAAPLSVTIRLLDLCSDKQPRWLSKSAASTTLLGLQGVRLYQLAPVQQVLQAQLEALDRLSEQYQLRILIPYLTRRDELQYWVTEIRDRLTNHIAIGAMVETPAGALELPDWFDLVDFVAIGCNDLMQCLFAADRDQPAVRHYLDPYAPLLYRFLRQLAQSCGPCLDRVQLCGVLPQLQAVLPVLIGLGFRVFSVEPRIIPHLVQCVENTSVSEAVMLANELCGARETREVRRLLGLCADGFVAS